MTELNSVISFLEDDSNKITNLFFIKRYKQQNTGMIIYKVYKTRISPDISDDVIHNALNQLNDESEKETKDYMELSGSDSNYNEKIDKEEIPHLSNILNQILMPDLEEFKSDIRGDISRYIIKVESPNKTLYLFKKYNTKLLIKKGILSIFLSSEGKYKKFGQDLILLDKNFDALLFLNDENVNGISEQVTGENLDIESNNTKYVFIFNRRLFEYFFSYTEYYEEYIVENNSKIVDKEILVNPGDLVEICTKNSTMARKLVKIIKSELFSSMTNDGIRNIINTYNININLDVDNKMVVNEENIWNILRVLDDDYLESENTSFKYETHSKLKKDI